MRQHLRETVPTTDDRALWHVQDAGSRYTVLNQGVSGSIREYQESRSGTGVSGAPDIRELGPTGYPGYLTGRDIRDITEDQG